jgi:hypothetical protein
MLVVLLAGQVLLPPLTAFFGMRLTSLWSMQAWFLLPIVLLSPSGVTVPRRRAEWVAAGVAAVAAAALLVSPALAWFYHLSGLRQDRAYFSAVSDELTRQWRGATDRPLPIVLGTTDLAPSTTFYMRSSALGADQLGLGISVDHRGTPAQRRMGRRLSGHRSPLPRNRETSRHGSQRGADE